jgi:hypothetical protein
MKPDFLTLTKEKLEKIEDEQAERRKQFGPRSILSPVEQKVAFARNRETAIRAGIESLLSSSDENRAELVDREMERLAEVLAEQGRYGEALLVAPEGARAGEYRSLIEAIERPDTEECGCPDEVNEQQGPHPIRLPRHYVHDHVWSYKHQKEMPVIRCSLCGHLNVRPLPGHIAHIVDAHAQSANSGEDPAQALQRVREDDGPDATVLKHSH